MNRIFVTGDKHGDHVFIKKFCDANPTVNKSDVIIILGDAGYNFFLDRAEHKRRKEISRNNITVLCIHGNHEERPYNIKGYKEVDFHGAKAYWKRKYPNLYFAKDGEYYHIGNHHFLVLGGAYSTDKYLRLKNNWIYYYSEQPNDEIKEHVSKTVRQLNYEVDVVLSHTCPKSFMEKAGLAHAYVDNHEIDWSTENWLEDIKNSISYNHWYFGHFHKNKKIDEKATLLYEDIIEIY